MNNDEKLEYNLRNWNRSSADSERLVAKLLYNIGYKFISTQNPRGGRDGNKDILCVDFRQRKTVVGVYFPTSQIEEKCLSKKFTHDLQGAINNNAECFVFCTNMYINAQFKEDLNKIAKNKNIDSIIYDIEELKIFLNSPSGYGIREDYFEIEISREEITALLDDYINKQNEVIKQIALQTYSIIDKILIGRDKSTFYSDLRLYIEAFSKKDLSLDNLKKLNLDILAQSSLPNYLKGSIREVQSWIGEFGKGIEDAVFVPAKAEDIIPTLKILINDWNSNKEIFKQIKGSENMYNYLARFHLEFLKIHPFYDGNGRVARIILAKQVYDIIGKLPVIFINDQQEYYNLLKNEDVDELTFLLKKAIIL